MCLTYTLRNKGTSLHAKFGVQTCPITERGACLNPEYYSLHICTFAPLKLRIYTLKGANITGAGLHPEGYTELRLQTCTLKGAQFS